MCNSEGAIFRILLLQTLAIFFGSTNWHHVLQEIIHPETDRRLKACKCLPFYTPTVSQKQRCVLFLSMASSLLGNLTQMPTVCSEFANLWLLKQTLFNEDQHTKNEEVLNCTLVSCRKSGNCSQSTWMKQNITLSNSTWNK